MKQFDLKEYLKNPNRKIITRDGCNARVICTDQKCCNYPVVALVHRGFGENPCSYTKDGLCVGDVENSNDLFFITEKKEGWINIRKNEIKAYPTGTIYNTKDEAVMADLGMTYHIDTIKIEWEE